VKKNKLFYQDNEITIFLIESKKYGTFQVKIDTKNWNRVKKYSWHINFNWKTKKIGAVESKESRVEYGRKQIVIHKLLTDYKMTDHIDGDVLNNLETNLRECNHSTNAMNKGKQRNNTSGFKGVYFEKNKWRAKIEINKKQVHLGYYSDKIEAAKAYNKAALKYHGEFSKINIL